MSEGFMTLAILLLEAVCSQAAGWRLAGAHPAFRGGDHARSAGAARTFARFAVRGLPLVVSGCPKHFRRSRLDQLISGGARRGQAEPVRPGRSPPRSGLLDAGGRSGATS